MSPREQAPEAEDKGRIVTAFLESFFTRYVEYDFTAALEEKLDRISYGELKWKDVLRDFWRDFSPRSTPGEQPLRRCSTRSASARPAHLSRRGEGPTPHVPELRDRQAALKLGKYGAFVGCSNYPECRYTRQLGMNGEDAAASASVSPEGTTLGEDPESGLPG